MRKNGIITDIQRFSVHDGPGIRTLVFLKGCPLDCPWCCNPETKDTERELVFYDHKCIGCNRCVEICPRSALGQPGKPRIYRDRCNLCEACVEVCPAGALNIIGDKMSVDEVFEVIDKDRVFYEKSGGGATFSGGEPLMQPEFLIDMLGKLRESGIHTAIETTGYASWNILSEVEKLVDLFLFDVKVFESAAHERITRVHNNLIMENLLKLVEMGSRLIVRIPVIPQYTHINGNIEKIIEMVASLKKIDTIHLLPFHQYGKSKHRYTGKDYDLDSIESPRRDELQPLVDLAQSLGICCEIGG
jgi:pyruvate formate lyase activating enzyme